MSTLVRERARELRRQGRPVKAIAAELKIDARTVSRYTQDVGEAREREQRTTRNEQIIALCKAGFTTREVAEMVGVSQNTVALASQDWREDERQRLRRRVTQMRAAKRTLKQIGDRLGLSPTTIHRILAKA